MRMKGAGFSLIELVIAVSLASFVLVAVAQLAMQMARNQADGIRSGTMTGWSVVSYLTMAKEIEDANVLAFPTDNIPRDEIVICKNWSRSAGAVPGTGARLDPSANVTLIQYCFDNTEPVFPQVGYTMRRFADNTAATTCPAVGSAVTCSATPTGTWSETGVVGFRVERLGGAAPFLRANAIGGVRVRYVIGQQVGTTQHPLPKFTTFDYGISMQKQLSSTVD